MLQNPCKTLGFKKNMVYKIPPDNNKSNNKSMGIFPKLKGSLLLCPNGWILANFKPIASSNSSNPSYLFSTYPHKVCVVDAMRGSRGGSGGPDPLP